MPNMDGTGPNGAGSMTGKKAGKCAGGQSQNVGRGQGLGRGRGLRRFFGSGIKNSQNLDDREKELLNELEQVRALKNNSTNS